jgi:dephospho-CoA kinase
MALIVWLGDASWQPVSMGAMTATSPQRRIGLTGGIASGKSSVARLLQRDHGLPLLDADVMARQALAPGTAAARQVADRYGDRVLTAGSDPVAAVLDRSALGQIVFGDAAQRQWLEQLVHPIVREGFAAELQRLAAAPTVVLVVPLLFEAGLEPLCSEVWLVDCDEHQQLQRLIGRDRLSEAEAEARIAAQWPLARKRPLVERRLENRGNPEALEGAVRAALQGPPGA